MNQLELALQEALKIRNKPKFILEDFLFKEQLAFVNDPARFATAVCSVRAGKTTSCAADLINTCLTMPGTISLYITLARSSAKRIVWPELHKIINQLKLEANFNETELSVKFPNGSVVYCSGANTEAETEKLRGLSNVALAYIDESQAFRTHIKELVEDVLVKRLYDTNGRCRLIGTPGPIPAGYFYDCSKSDKWSHHSWTLHSNPFIERKSGLSVAQLIQQDMDRKGVTIDDPSIQRECFGRWVLDANSLLLEYDISRNHFDALPMGNFNYILGIDLGFDDSDSLSVLAYSDISPCTYLVEEVITAKQTIDALMSQISKLTVDYKIHKIVADTGGLGKKIVESFKARYPFPIEQADKTGKMANYALLNNALKRGDFKANKNSRFAQDCNILERDKEKSTPEKIIVKGHSDAVDSVLYSFKESPAYYYVPPVIGPKPGSKEYEEQQTDILFNHHVATLERQRKQKDGQEFGSWEVGQDMAPPWSKWSD